jgi:hypothetical protein
MQQSRAHYNDKGMDASQFKNLSELAPGKHVFSELHVLACDPPRPVAVRVKQNYHILPQSLWSVAEFVARACQNVEVESMPACGIYQCLIQLLAKVVDATSVLKEPCDLRGEVMLTLLLPKRRQERPKLLALTDAAADAVADATKVKARSRRKAPPETWHLTDLD